MANIDRRTLLYMSPVFVLVGYNPRPYGTDLRHPPWAIRDCFSANRGRLGRSLPRATRVWTARILPDIAAHTTIGRPERTSLHGSASKTLTGLSLFESNFHAGPTRRTCFEV
jgi:hypothetical protein